MDYRLWPVGGGRARGKSRLFVEPGLHKRKENWSSEITRTCSR